MCQIIVAIIFTENVGPNIHIDDFSLKAYQNTQLRGVKTIFQKLCILLFK